MNLAIGFAIDGDDRAVASFARAAEHAEALARLRADDRRTLVVCGQIHFNQGAFLAERDRLAEAAVALARGVDWARRAVAATPADPARGCDLLRCAVRLAQVTELADPAAAAPAWQDAARARDSLLPAALASIRGSHAMALADCMLSRALAARGVRAGDVAAGDGLVAVQQRLENLLERTPDRATALLELCLCIADRHAGELGAPADAALAAALAQRVRGWPADARLDHLPRRRLRARLGELEVMLAGHADAVARLRAIAAGD